MSDAGVTKVECPDATTMIVTTDDASDRVLQVALPIIPKHIWGDETYATIGKAKFEPPLVGTGPYQAVDWQTGQFIRLQRNPNYWGDQGFADEVDLVIFKTADTMVQALKTGELDYAHGINAEQFDALATDEDIATVVGSANGWTQLGFNGYGAGTGKTIPNGGPSTQALLDPKFRDALGYAVDHEELVERVLGGYGDVGTTIVPPVLTSWHVEPTTMRTFDIELAKQKLEDAGYRLDADGRRLDKEGKPITLRLVMPDSDENYPKAAQFIAAWYGELGINADHPGPELGGADRDDLSARGRRGLHRRLRHRALGLERRHRSERPAVDLQVRRDRRLVRQPVLQPGIRQDVRRPARGVDRRGAQGHPRRDAEPHLRRGAYDILFYDANLVGYRTDRFAGFENQPANGTPFFTYSTLGYTKLDRRGARIAGPIGAGARRRQGRTWPPRRRPSRAAPTPAAASSTTPILVGLLAVVAVGAVGLALYRRAPAAATVEDDE